MTLRSDIPKIIVSLSKATAAARLRTAHLIRNNAIEKIMREAKSGRRYGNHVASAPGQAPASDSGRLVQGITVRDDPGRNVTLVVASADYSSTLEFGNSKIAPRPFLRPSLAKVTEANIAQGFVLK